MWFKKPCQCGMMRTDFMNVYSSPRWWEKTVPTGIVRHNFGIMNLFQIQFSMVRCPSVETPALLKIMASHRKPPKVQLRSLSPERAASPVRHWENNKSHWASNTAEVNRYDTYDCRWLQVLTEIYRNIVKPCISLHVSARKLVDVNVILKCNRCYHGTRHVSSRL